MAIENIGGQIRYISDVEPWMRDQGFTEVFNFSLAPYSDEEMKITAILDSILNEVIFGRAGIDEMAKRAKAYTKRMITGRRAKTGEQSLGSWQGSAIDDMFKGQVETELKQGRLAQYSGRLRPIPGGAQGPDIVLDGTPLIAWDVTTQAAVDYHIRRDAIGSVKARQRLFDRYYLLVWDEPRTKKNTLLKALALERTSGA